MEKREIKFRAWKHSNNASDNGMHDGIYLANGICFKKNGEQLYLREVDYKLMQYTGLKDKNGVEIYEGDLLRNGGDLTPAEVKFEKGMFVVGNYGCELYRYSGDEKEVVGNIYELTN